MGLLNVAAGAPPVFLLGNLINTDAIAAGGITVNSGSAFIARAIDMAAGSYYTSQGSNDATTEFYDAKFYSGPTLNPQNVDTIILWNINLKSFTIKYYLSGALIASVPVSNWNQSYYILNLSSPVTMDEVRIEATTTQVANQDKTLKVYAGLALYQTIRGMSTYKSSNKDGIKVVVMADGTQDETLIQRSDGSFQLYMAKVGLKACSRAERDAIKAIKNNPAYRHFVWWPEPGDIQADIFAAHFAPGSFNDNYLSLARDAGYTVDFEIEEIGAQ